MYGDTVLQTLIETALAKNYDMLTAMARIDESRATAGYSKADIYPSLNYGVGGSKLNLDNSQANDLGISQRDLFTEWGCCHGNLTSGEGRDMEIVRPRQN